MMEQKGEYAVRFRPGQRVRMRDLPVFGTIMHVRDSFAGIPGPWVAVQRDDGVYDVGRFGLWEPVR